MYMRAVEYDHSKNLHSISGPRVALPCICGDGLPSSLLDVGCGTGAWLKAAMESGISDVFGVDGVEIPEEDLLVPVSCVGHYDLTQAWDLGRCFVSHCVWKWLNILTRHMRQLSWMALFGMRLSLSFRLLVLGSVGSIM
jgi:hypothetical protein